MCRGEGDSSRHSFDLGVDMRSNRERDKEVTHGNTITKPEACPTPHSQRVEARVYPSDLRHSFVFRWPDPALAAGQEV